MHAVIENLTECYTTIRQLHHAKEPVAPQAAANLIATQLSNTARLIRAGTSGDRAKNIANKTGNLLFAAGQELQSTFGIKGHVDDPVPYRVAVARSSCRGEGSPARYGIAIGNDVPAQAGRSSRPSE